MKKKGLTINGIVRQVVDRFSESIYPPLKIELNDGEIETIAFECCMDEAEVVDRIVTNIEYSPLVDFADYIKAFIEKTENGYTLYANL